MPSYRGALLLAPPLRPMAIVAVGGKLPNVNRYTFWWRLRSMLGATLVGFGWRRPRAIVALRRREPWWRRVWHVFRPEPQAPSIAYAGPPPWIQPSEAEFGVAVPLREVLASDADVAIGLIDCVAYSNGFEFSLGLRAKHELDSIDMGFGPPPPYGPDRSDKGLTFGIQFADGRKAITGGNPSPELMAQWKMHAEGREPSPSDGPILSPRGGALGQMLLPARSGVAGRIGPGTQHLPWISIEDTVGALHFALQTESIEGPVNLAAPGVVTNATFMKTLGHVLHRPSLLPLPAFAVRAAFGEMGGALLLGSQKVKPTALERAGFPFLHPTLEGALRFVLGKNVLANSVQQ